jgi:oxygen-dependent protoporphyrinogen oxidase
VRAAGGEIRTGVRVAELAPDGAMWRVDGERFDAVVLACPAPAAARLLATTQGGREASDAMATIETADVAIVTLDIDPADWPASLRGYSGYLVPKPVQRLVTAASFGSQKWRHWDDGRGVVLRVSLGRDGLPVLDRSDEQLLAAAVDEVGHHLGLMLQPRHARVTRWPGAFPQYRPHHAELVAAIEAALPSGLVVAGASYHGIGVPACIKSARNAAQATSNSAPSVAE